MGETDNATRGRAGRHLAAWLLALGLGQAGRAQAQVPGGVLLDDSAMRLAPNATSIAVTRAQLILFIFIWGGRGFPYDKQPSSVRTGVASPVRGLPNLRRVDALTISMDLGLETVAYHFVPETSRNRLVAVHHGHVCGLDDGPGSGEADLGVQRTLAALLAQGYAVLAFNMPHQRPGDCLVNPHHPLFDLDTTGSALKFFLEPVAAGLNYVARQGSPDERDISLIGLSGGGWTTTVYAALDPRIRLSIPVAGSVPLHLRVEPYRSHDKEQYLDAFYRLAGYLDLYALGADGPGRRQVQVLNRHDGCCFGEPQHDASALRMSFDQAVRGYEAKVKGFLAQADGGVFRLIVDEAAPDHRISDHALHFVILPALNGDAALVTTLRSVERGDQCLAVPEPGDPPGDPDPLQLDRCVGSARQVFDLRSDGTIRTHAGLCLEAPDAKEDPRNRGRLQASRCHDGTNQRFDLRDDGTIRARGSGWCLEVPDPPRKGQGVDPIELRECAGSPRQRFSVNR